ncbi:UNKNOWN [Stylonychia lemnae]|uniref:Uncharacterized protein n=1 Tax=Stylonychia lemnae TaxID=5949 RepID=A0A078B1L8_STYLE|nr:UNKNOWN [Stylonychia lemnae]|eukprot:CDW88460.1 UNKNOWN [Stylonychia lemnae]
MFLKELIQHLQDFKASSNLVKNDESAQQSQLEELIFEAQSKDLEIDKKFREVEMQLKSQQIEHKNIIEEMRIRYDLRQLDMEKQIQRYQKQQPSITVSQDKYAQIVRFIQQQLEQIQECKDISETKTLLQNLQAQIKKNQTAAVNNDKNFNDNDTFGVQNASGEGVISQDLADNNQQSTHMFNANQVIRIKPVIPQLQLQNIGARANNTGQSPRQLQNVLSDNTLSLTNYSKIGQNQNLHHQIRENHYKSRKDHLMAKGSVSRDSQRAASDSASVNKAIMYSENSIPQLFSSLEQSRRNAPNHNKNGPNGNILRDMSRQDESQNIFKTADHMYYNNTEQYEYQRFNTKSQSPVKAHQLKYYNEERRHIKKQPSLSLTQKEKLLCEIHQRNQTTNAIGKNYNYQHIRPDEVMRTFGNSIDQSKQSLMFSSKMRFQEDSIKLSPINKDNNNQREFVNQVQKIAKEIKEMPSEQVMLTQQKHEKSRAQHRNLDDADEYDSLLEELEKLSARKINNDMIMSKQNLLANDSQTPNRQNQNHKDQNALRDFIDVPFSRVVSSIETIKQNKQQSNANQAFININQENSQYQNQSRDSQQKQQRSIYRQQHQSPNTRLDNYDSEVQKIMLNNNSGSIDNSFWDIREYQRLKKQSKSKLEERNHLQNANNSMNNQFLLNNPLDFKNLQSPFAQNSRSQAQAYPHNINQIRQHQQQQQQNQDLSMKQQLNNGNNNRNASEKGKYSLNKNQIRFFNLNSLVNQLRQDKNQSPTQNIIDNKNTSNNFIEVNNSVIIVQSNKADEMIKTQNLNDNRRQSPANQIDRPFTEMRKLKSNKNSFANNKNQISRVISQAHNPNRRVNSMTANQKQYDQYLNSAYQINQNSMNNYHHNKSVGEEQIQFANMNAQGFQSEQASAQRNFIGNSQIKRRLQNISAIDQAYLNQSTNLIRQSPDKNRPNISFGKRPQSSLNNSNIAQQNIEDSSPYLINTNPVNIGNNNNLESRQQSVLKTKQMKISNKRIVQNNTAMAATTNNGSGNHVLAHFNPTALQTNAYQALISNGSSMIQSPNQLDLSQLQQQQQLQQHFFNQDMIAKGQQQQHQQQPINDKTVRVIKKNIIKKINNQIVIGQNDQQQPSQILSRVNGNQAEISNELIVQDLIKSSQSTLKKNTYSLL